MKQIVYIASALALLASCRSGDGADAYGTFEATEILISSEACGRILRFDIEEGMTVNEGDIIAEVDSLQLTLQRKQLKAQMSALLAGRPDKKAQIASLKEQIAKQKTELARVENLLRGGAAPTLTGIPIRSMRTHLPSRPRSRLWKTGSRNAVRKRRPRALSSPNMLKPVNLRPRASLLSRLRTWTGYISGHISPLRRSPESRSGTM